MLERHHLAQRLRRRVRGAVYSDAASRGRYATDASIYQIDPVAVLVPEDMTDVEAALELCRENSVPVLPRGAGTSQCGQTVGAALVIDYSKHINRLLRFDPAARTVDVEPGLVLDHLNAQLKGKGLWFPVDVSTAAQATLGGMAGNNSCGSRSLAYGNMVHNTEAIKLMLADGTVEWFGPFGVRGGERMKTARGGALVSRLFEIGQAHREQMAQHFPKVMRRVGGYNLDVFHPQSERPYTADGSVNLAHLLVGSEGSLGLFRKLRLKLSPLPQHKVLGVVNFAKFFAAMDSAQHIVKLKPSAVELVDRTMIDLARENPAFRRVIETALVDPNRATPEAILLVEFSGEEQASLLRRLDDLVSLMGDLGQAGSVVKMPDDASQKALWEVRKAGLNIMMSLRGDGKPVSFIEDCAVPLEHLAEYTTALSEVFARHRTRGTWYAHASVGTLHVRPILDMRRDGAIAMREIANEASALVRRFKGAFSGEHGDGLVRSEWVRWQFGDQLNIAFEQLKDAFDPQGLMNPGKIVRAPSMDQRELFRYRPGYAMRPLHTALDWSSWDVQNDPLTEALSPPGSGGDPAQGFGKAIEMCNNNGHCRKFDAAVMCPSYRVTRDEQHSVRGRANTLRLAASGQLGAAGLKDPAVAEALSLCVSCKGCRRECPTGVDMAKMKIEVLAQRRGQFRPSLRDQMIARIPQWARYLSWLPGLLNWASNQSLLRQVLQALTGIAAKGRSLPRWASRPFHRRSSPPLESARVQAFLATQPAAREVTGHDRQKEVSPEPTRASSAGATASSESGSASAGEAIVILWADSFNNYFEPEILEDAMAVLQAAGCRVIPQHQLSSQGQPLCCGRSSFACGDIEAAKQHLEALLDAVAPWIENGAWVVGVEPSCLLTMRDELLSLRLQEKHRRLARLLAQRALLLEEYLERELEKGRIKLALSPMQGQTAWLHGHCHQKAFDAVSPALRLLERIPGLQTQLIQGSCCGMAGAFGYDVKTIEISKAMAEATLLPAVRAAKTDDWIVADGTSCRHQIHDGAQRKSVHVATLLAWNLGLRAANLKKGRP
jgi:FAD/FMN-containing dehydrogenase/Fe-S oxidoreductase